MSRYIPKRSESRNSNRYLYTMLIATLYTTAKKWKQPVSINRPMDKQNGQNECSGVCMCINVYVHVNIYTSYTHTYVHLYIYMCVYIQCNIIQH